MALISQQLPNLIGGISQQSSEFRRANQCADSANTYNDPVQGVTKRAGSQFVAALSTPATGYFGSIERDEVERYLFHVSATGIKVWTQAGVEVAVTAPSGWGYLAGASYYRHISIADTTFIVNPTVTVATSAVLTPASTCSGLLFIRAIDYNLKYSVDIEGVGAVPVSYTAPASGTISTEAAATALAASMDAQPNITASARGSVIKYTVTGNYTITASSNRGDSYFTVINGVIENFGDLPAVGYNGAIVKVAQNPTTDVDDYYVKFIGSATGSNGTWEETAAPGIKHQLDAATMPHVLVREAGGTFTFKPFTWANRVAGDLSSNPDPSFVGEKISNVLFENNRLGLLSDVNIILSESSGLDNFFRTTVSTVVDSDPIDIAVSGRQVDQLKTAIGVKDGILLFSENGQFLLNIGDADIVSPETASIVAVSSYKSNTQVEPARIGDSIMFLTRRDEKSGVREYFYQSGRDYTQSASITGHVPQLLPIGIKNVTGSSTENIVFFTPTLGSTLYVYQYLFSGEEKVVSAWTKWNFGSAEIKYTVVFDDFLYVVLSRGAVITLEKVRLSTGYVASNLPGEIHLDESSFSSGASRSIAGPNTVFTFNRRFSTPTPVVVSASVLPALDVFRGDRITPVSVATVGATTVVTLAGNWSASDFYIGTPYIFYYEVSPPYIRKDDGDVEIGGRLQIRNTIVQLNNTGGCQFRVIYTQEGTTDIIRSIEDVEDWSDIADMSTLETISITDDGGEVYQLSRAFPEINLDTRLQLINHPYIVPVMCENTGYRLRIESDGWQPVTLSKIQWEALYHKRAR